MPYVLTVTEPVDGFDIGKRIYDPAEAEKLQHSRSVKRVWVADEDMPKADPAPTEEPVVEPKRTAKSDTLAK